MILRQVIEAAGALKETPGHPESDGGPQKAGLPLRRRSSMRERSCGVSFWWRGFPLGFSG